MLFVDTAYFKMVVYNNMLFFKLFTRSPHYSVDLSSLPQYHLSREKYNKITDTKINQTNKQTYIQKGVEEIQERIKEKDTMKEELID